MVGIEEDHSSYEKTFIGALELSRELTVSSQNCTEILYSWSNHSSKFGEKDIKRELKKFRVNLSILATSNNRGE